MKTKSTTKAILLLSAGLSVLSPGLAAAENFKVLGRGVQNAENGHLLQIACVGPKNDAGEADCGTIRFLLSKASGEAKLVGPAVKLEKKPTEEVKAFVSALRKSHSADSIEGRSFDVLPWTHSMGSTKSVGGTALVIGGIAFLAGGPIMGAAAAAGFGITLVVDFIRLPFRLKERILTGEAFLARDAVEPGGSLTARDRDYWQLKGREVSAKAFRRLYKAIADDDADYIDASETACALRSLKIVPKPGRSFYPVGIAWQMRHRIWSNEDREAVELTQKDATYMLRDLYYSLPKAENGLNVVLEMSTPSGLLDGFAGNGNSRYCFWTRIYDAKGTELWSKGKRCDNLRNGLTKLARKLPSCRELNRF